MVGSKRVLEVYGFGSYFKLNKSHRDIDLLLIHMDLSEDSCQFAIYCKSYLQKKIDQTDIVMLSRQEAQTSEFLLKSEAVYLGSVSPQESKDSLEEIIEKIRNHFKSL